MMLRPGTMVWALAERVASRHGYDFDTVAGEVERLMQHTKSAPQIMLNRLAEFEVATQCGIPGFVRVADIVDATAVEIWPALACADDGR